jgi:hypothetical protein
MHLVSCKANTNLFRYRCRSSMQSQGVISAIVAFKRYMKHKGMWRFPMIPDVLQQRIVGNVISMVLQARGTCSQ